MANSCYKWLNNIDYHIKKLETNVERSILNPIVDRTLLAPCHEPEKSCLNNSKKVTVKYRREISTVIWTKFLCNARTKFFNPLPHGFRILWEKFSSSVAIAQVYFFNLQAFNYHSFYMSAPWALDNMCWFKFYSISEHRVWAHEVLLTSTQI